MIGPKLAEDPTMPFESFMIKEPKSDFSLAAFSSLIARGNKGLCITRVPPEKLGALAQQEGVKIHWLSKKTGENTIPPSLTKISHEIMEHMKNEPNCVILLDGLEYIINNVEFMKVLRFVNELVDSVALHKNILIIPMNPLTMDPKQLALIERDMMTLDMTAAEQLHEVSSPEEAGPEGKYKFNGEGLKLGRNRMFEMVTRQILDIAEKNMRIKG